MMGGARGIALPLIFQPHGVSYRFFTRAICLGSHVTHAFMAVFRREIILAFVTTFSSPVGWPVP